MQLVERGRGRENGDGSAVVDHVTVAIGVGGLISGLESDVPQHLSLGRSGGAERWRGVSRHNDSIL